MRHLTIEHGEKKPIAYCECCDKPLYKGDKVIRDSLDFIIVSYFCDMECLFNYYPMIETITLGEEVK